MDYSSQGLLAISATLLAISVISVNAQISTPCTISMISSFTPCINFITGSSNNGTSPTQSCCRVVKSLMGTSVDCACLLVTANVPFPLPVNRTLALSLPRACNIASVPVQCKATGSPLPSPGSSFGPAPSPLADSPFSPQASKAVAQAPAPETRVELAPAFPPVEPEAPEAQGIRPVLTPSSSNPSCVFPYYHLLIIFVGFLIFKLH